MGIWAKKYFPFSWSFKNYWTFGELWRNIKVIIGVTYKEDVDGKTKSNLKHLSHQERINEIAEMIGGKQLTETALNHAKELLNNKV